MPAHWRWIRCLLGLTAWLLASVVATAQPGTTLEVDKGAIRAAFRPGGVVVSIPVSNPQTAPVSASLRAELLDPDDKVLATETQSVLLPAGSSVQSVTLPLDSAATDERLWSRVRCRLAPEGGGPVVTAIVSLAAATPELFVLRVAYAPDAFAGAAYRLRVQAVNPVTRRPIAGVPVTGAVDPHEGDPGTPAAAARTTNRNGEAVLRWPSGSIKAGAAGEIVIRGKKGSLEQQASVDVRFSAHHRFVTSTDKRLYQPGQALHARTLLFDSRKHAMPGAPVRFRLDDPDGTTLFSVTATTNRFGVASVDWQLPDTAGLGNYLLATELSGVDEGIAEGGASLVRVRRYELPTFTVTASPDRSYYLPRQDVMLSVDAKYLFGRPVAGGAVRVVREAERHWDFAKRAWVFEDEDEATAELDAAGHAAVTLSGLSTLTDWARFRAYRDVTLAVYVTDHSTRRTEQRRVAVRLSREPIHVYVTGERGSDAGVSFYVTTCYPDGEPAVAALQITQAGANGVARVFRTLRTNRFGAARVRHLRLEGEAGASSELVVEARDKAGNRGSTEVSSYRIHENSVEVSTDKTVYRPGEPLIVSVASEEWPRVVVDAVKDGETVWSTEISLRRGHGFSAVPYREQFVGPITLFAYPADSSRREATAGYRTVVYPHDSDLHVRVRPTRRVYAPGDEFAAAIRVTTATGAPAPGVLGVTMVDKAVDERARTDEEFEGTAAGFWSWTWWRRPGRVGSLTMRELARLNLAEEIPPDVDLAAEVLLASEWFSWNIDFEGYDFDHETRARFRKRIESQLSPVGAALRRSPTMPLPSNDGELYSALDAAGVAQETLTDPWGTPFQFRYSLDVRDRVVSCFSAGPDRQPGTRDDVPGIAVVWNHFTPHGVLLDRAVNTVHERSGGYIRDLAALRAAMREAGVNVDRLRDPFGLPYEFAFDVERSSYRILVRSTRVPYPVEVVWTSSIDYFARARADLETVYTRYHEDAGHLPRTDAELDRALERAGSNFRSLRDPWGSPYCAIFETSFEYGDEFQYSATSPTNPVTAVTKTIEHVRMMSAGPDATRGTPDDFELASVARTVSLQSGRDTAPVPVASAPVAGDVGSIEGTVADASPAVMPGVRLSCQSEAGGKEYAAVSDGGGRFAFTGLPGGRYRVHAELVGFRPLTVRSVPVLPGRATPVHLTLAVAAVTETVEVTAAAAEANTSMSAASPARQPEAASRPVVRERTFTPRVREYFPETLYWAPSVETGAAGSAKVSVKLADTMTTWRMAVLASTTTGEVGFGETEVEAFQPFFVEHDPPKVLTAGDRIDLPVVLRNYQAQAGEVRVELGAAPWFTSNGATSRTVSVPAGGFANVAFPFTATTVVSGGRQRVTAAAGTFGDAVEKPVTVHADGEERHVTAAGLLRDRTTVSVRLPENLLAGSRAATVRVYPNLLAHVVDGIEATMERPYGCGEQAISSAYPSVLLLKHFKAAGVSGTAIARKAESYARAGIDRLLRHRSPDGGFGYWSPADPDIALTAYAVRFLSDASDVLRVPPTHIAAAANWLVSRQHADGTWPERYGDGEALSATVALALARGSERLADPELQAKVHASIRTAASLIHAARQPYTVAQLALAAWVTGMPDEAHRGVERLKSSARHEGTGAYWVLETNTPFYGWGNAGRIESTAVVLQALRAIDGTDGSRPLVDAGVAFLLSQKDRYGIWLSGHATLEVLSALLDVFGTVNGRAGGGTATVVVNGQPAFTLDLPSGMDAGPVMRDISALLRPGVNTIDIARTGTAQYASVQVVSGFYVPWSRSGETRSVQEANESRGLRMAVDFDRTSVRVGEEVRVSVDLERVGHRGYGMLLAEVGLPPGADVERASLERAVSRSGSGLCHYEIQPDRVVFYVWPVAGGTRFSFTFKPRFALAAKTAASFLYDYYNPDERATLPAAAFAVSAAETSGQPANR
jgi:hypothetical protein